VNTLDTAVAADTK